MPIQTAGSVTVITESAIAASSATANAIGRPGKTTGREVISSWSLAKVTTEPAKEIEPTTIVNAVAASTNQFSLVGVRQDLVQLQQGDQGRGATADAVEQRHHLRHLRHLDPLGPDDAAGRAERDRDQDQRDVVEVEVEERDGHGDDRRQRPR